MGILQVRPWQHWPSGDSRPIAVLPFDIAALVEWFGLTFHEGVDDLDRYQVAAITLGDGQQAWLIRYEGDPGPGTVALVDSGADVEDAQSLLAQALGLNRDAFLWTAPIPASTRQVIGRLRGWRPILICCPRRPTFLTCLIQNPGERRRRRPRGG